MDLKTTYLKAQERLRSHLCAVSQDKNPTQLVVHSQEIEAWQTDRSRLWREETPVLSAQIFGSQGVARDLAAGSKRQIPAAQTTN